MTKKINHPSQRTKKSFWGKTLHYLPLKWLFKISLVVLFLVIIYSPSAQHYLNKGQRALDETFQNIGLSYETYIIDGRKYTPQTDVLNAIEHSSYRSLPFYELNKALENLHHLPWVLKASISKEYPNKLSIKLLEKTPTARFQLKKQLYVLDQFGNIIKGADPKKFKYLILFVGPNANNKAPKILSELNRYTTLKRSTSALTLVNNRRWDLYLKNKAIVKMPKGQFSLGLKKLQALDDIGSLLHRKVKIIDLRFKDKVIIESTNNSKFEY